MKPQLIRILDVIAIGPIMIWSGYKLQKKYIDVGDALILLGLATVGYNYLNYIKQQTTKTEV